MFAYRVRIGRVAATNIGALGETISAIIIYKFFFFFRYKTFVRYNKNDEDSNFLKTPWVRLGKI